MIRKVAKKVLELEGYKGVGFSVIYVTARYIKRLNQRYKKRNTPTDVLAFSAREGKIIKGDNRFLGDIVISVDAAEKQAEYFNSTKNKELKLYLIHGILHLLGYDEGNIIEKRQSELFTKIKI